MENTTLQEHEKISKEMFYIFGKAAMTFIEVVKNGYKIVNNDPHYDKMIINKHFNNYKTDVELFIDKVKKHYSGERVEYDFSEISLLSAMTYIFHKQSDTDNQIIGYIFNNDIRYSHIFEESNEKIEDMKVKLSMLEKLIRSMAKKMF